MPESQIATLPPAKLFVAVLKTSRRLPDPDDDFSLSPSERGMRECWVYECPIHGWVWPMIETTLLPGNTIRRKLLLACLACEDNGTARREEILL